MFFSLLENTLITLFRVIWQDISLSGFIITLFGLEVNLPALEIFHHNHTLPHVISMINIFI